MDAQAQENLLVVIKGTYDVGDGVAEICDEQDPVRFADEYYGEPGQSSIRWASDVVLSKPSTDVILLADAYADRNNRQTVDVSLRIGRLRKSVRVSGDRTWKKRLGMTSVGGPEPFEQIPLVWERAFGGVDDSDGNSVESENRNPVGVGFLAKRSKRPIEDRLPNLEDPRQPMRSPRDRPNPACFSFVAPSWMPRAKHTGTYDENWRKSRAPLLPTDFSDRFFQSAPEDQIYDGYVEDGAPVEATHVTPDGPMIFDLPAPRLAARVKAGSKRLELEMHCDTVIVDARAQRLMLCWRGSAVIHNQVYEVEWIRLSLEKE
jgi:hypothetical protein